ncbi:hypothetical protein TB2_032992 [Malus domestica]
MEVYHETCQSFTYDAKPLATQVQDSSDRPENPRVSLEIDLSLFVNKKYYVNISEESEDDEAESIPIVQDKELKELPSKSLRITVHDVRYLDDHNAYKENKDGISGMLKEHEIIKGESLRNLVVERILNQGRRIGKSDSNKGPKKLRLRVDMKRDHIWDMCEMCSDERVIARDAQLKKTLKRARVVADDHDDEEDEDKDEDGDEVGERKKRRIVHEGEVCCVCTEEFVAGSKDVKYLPCSHVFHGKCIGAWLRERKDSCPVCRYCVELPNIEHGSQDKIEKPMCTTDFKDKDRLLEMEVYHQIARNFTCDAKPLPTEKIFEDKRFSVDLVVRKIVNEVNKLRNLDSNKGPKVLRLKVDIERHYFLDVCKWCTDEANALFKKTLKRARVITGDHDDDFELQIAGISLIEIN